MKIFPNKTENSKGFTLIEVMISIGLFTVVMIIGITAILSVNNTYRKTRTMRSAIDNLSFIMEDMARNIRLGTRYRCLGSLGDINNDSTNINEPRDSAPNQICAGLAFEPFWNPTPGELGESDDQVIYLVDGQDIFKTVHGAYETDTYFSTMNSEDVRLDPLTSGFYVYGSDSEDGEQPSVLIILNGEVSSSGNTTKFNLQTTVTQRMLDVPPVN